jgi:WD40 repeat protein
VQNLVDETQEIGTFIVSSIAFTADSRYLAVPYSSGLALYARLDSGWRRTGALAPGALQVAFSPDGGRLAGTTGKQILLYEVPSGRILSRWPGLRTGIESGFETLAYRADGAQLAVGEGVQLGFFSPVTGGLLKVLELATPYSVKALSYAPNSRYLAVGAAAAAYLVDVASFVTVAVLNEHAHSVDRLSISPDGAKLAAIGGSVVTIWELSGLER